jgi:hypothetical protein
MDAIEKPEDLVRHLEYRKKVYVRWYIAMTLVTIGVSMLITIFGALQWPTLAACLGAFSAFLLGAEKAFSVGDKRAMYKFLAGEARILEWQYREATSDESRAKIKEKLMELLATSCRFDSREKA